jgi:MOSC domain-containing protein YiiM
MPSVLAACVVAELRHDAGTVGITAIDKRPVDGPIKVGPWGLYADVQADRHNHGGHDKAVYVYGQDDAAFWSAELGRDLALGFFGENLRIEGLDPNEARVGERWRIGTVELEVTGPRRPCQTFARWVGPENERGWVKRFSREARVGAYFRVLKPGHVAAGDEIEILHVPLDAPTVREII